MEQWQMLTGELEHILDGYNKGRVFYYTPYYAGRGYSSSGGTSDIQNFKKPVDRRNKWEWRYREEAVNKFAEILLKFDYPPNSLLVPAPTSQPRQSEDWNDRIDTALKIMQQKNKAIKVQPLIDTKEPMLSSHLGGSRDYAAISANVEWGSDIGSFAPVRCSHIFIVDDVITTGNHLRSYADKVCERYPDTPIHALVWGYSVHDEPNG
jgi:hypothetical protein